MSAFTSGWLGTIVSRRRVKRSIVKPFTVIYLSTKVRTLLATGPPSRDPLEALTVSRLMTTSSGSDERWSASDARERTGFAESGLPFPPRAPDEAAEAAGARRELARQSKFSLAPSSVNSLGASAFIRHKSIP
jgi:hypothetical protein